YNLVHYLGELGAEIVVRRNDALDAKEALALKPEAVVLSPGPCDPDRAGICLALIAPCAAARLPLLRLFPGPQAIRPAVGREGGLPLLGVCLGHQAIGQAFGGKVVRAPEPIHGKVSAMRHQGRSVLKGLPSPFEATRYHSLIVDRASLPACLEITAETEDG